VTDPFERPDDVTDALQLVVEEATRYLRELDDSVVRLPGADEAAVRFAGRLPDEGSGASAALRELIENGLPAAVRSFGPRMFHFVTGGVTPAAVGADWLTSAIDQNAFSWVGTPLGSRLEAVSVGWLKELFGLPESWAGVLTTGATMANLTALAAARRWFGARLGVDVEERGMSGLPPRSYSRAATSMPAPSRRLPCWGSGARAFDGSRATGPDAWISARWRMPSKRSAARPRSWSRTRAM
jgi:Pyridoxal-dependent decarboxylase conserved domain